MATEYHYKLAINRSPSQCRYQFLPLSSNMKLVILSLLAAVATAAPGYDSPAARSLDESPEHIAILRDDRVHEEDGRYSVDVETANNIALSESGAPTGPEDSVVQAGEFSYISPEGTPVHVKYVADENGFQPESDLLPVAPVFPHPIPQFVQDQIDFAAEEDAKRSRSEPTRLSGKYGAV